jgi:acyl-CoA thioesterase I
VSAARLRLLLTVFALLLVSGAASARTIHIVAFGDSATDGWLVKRDEAYPAQLQALLRKKGYDVSVTNAGVSGGTTVDALERFDTAIAPGTDIALIEFGTNDLRLHLPAPKMHANLAEIVKSLQKRGIAVMLIGLGSLDLSAVARASNVPYAQWTLPPGKYRARDHAHFNAEGYAIVVNRMLPQVEELIARVKNRP